MLRETKMNGTHGWKSFKAVEEQAVAICTAMDVLYRIKSKTVLDVGVLLNEAYERFNKNRKWGEGVFLKWCRDRIKVNKTTAYKWMRVADCFSNFPQCVQSIAPSALYVLSEPITPAEVRRDAIELAEKGEEVSHRRAKELVAAALEQRPGPKVGDPNPDDGPEYLSELRMLWRQFVKTWQLASADERDEFKVWRVEDPKARLSKPTKRKKGKKKAA